MQLRPSSSTSRHQRGASALIVTMLLLFTSSIVVFYLNRGLVFEQKISANQVRSTSAFEVAEAGLEWATGKLNSPNDIDTNCNLLSTTNVSFRTKYIQADSTTSNVWSAATTYPGCKIDGTTLTCSCPNVPAPNTAAPNPTWTTNEAFAGLGTAVLPSFTIKFENVGDAQAVRVISTGCTVQAGSCRTATAITPAGATTSQSDAWAQVSAILKLRPLLRAAPSAALTCGTSCAVGGSYNIYNYDVAANGYLVNAGTTITSGNGTSYGTIPGQPLQNALIANDSSLSSIASADPTCTSSAMFRTYFGISMAEYAASPTVRTIANCTVPSSCGALVHAAVSDGWRNLYFPNGLALNNSAPFSVLGAAGAGNGVNIVSPGDIDINGNISIYGLLFSNSANVNDLGTGTANIFGAMVTCAGYSNNGNGTLTYDSNALGGVGLRPGTMARVPGSWRDFTP